MKYAHMKAVDNSQSATHKILNKRVGLYSSDISMFHE